MKDYIVTIKAKDNAKLIKQAKRKDFFIGLVGSFVFWFVLLSMALTNF